jgi:hypothetical protein
VKNPDKALREQAYRARAGMIGELTSCICSYPLERFDTSSGHHEACAAHLCHLSMIEVVRRNPDHPLVVQVQPFAVWTCGEGWSARCRTCGAEPAEQTLPRLVARMSVEHAHARSAGIA